MPKIGTPAECLNEIVQGIKELGLEDFFEMVRLDPICWGAKLSQVANAILKRYAENHEHEGLVVNAGPAQRQFDEKLGELADLTPIPLGSGAVVMEDGVYSSVFIKHILSLLLDHIQRSIENYIDE